MTEAGGPRQPAISVLLADDHPVVRQGLAALLGTLPGVTVVAQAGNGEEAIREVGLNRPDVVMDLRMPKVDGVEATRRIVRDYPGTAVLVLTMFDEDALVSEALRAAPAGTCSRSRSRTRSNAQSERSRPGTRSSAAPSPAAS